MLSNSPIGLNNGLFWLQDNLKTRAGSLHWQRMTQMTRNERMSSCTELTGGGGWGK